MEGVEGNHSLVLRAYGELPTWEKFPVQEPSDDEVLIQVQASTINPADHSLLNTGFFIKSELPILAGYEGVGRVIKVGKNAQEFYQKRVCFSKMGEQKNNFGSWSNYTTAHLGSIFAIEEDVSVQSAASGIINPLTVIGIFSVYRKLVGNGTGIIQTVASSALGRMINRLCIKQKIPLINLVRRPEHIDLLKSEGAEHVVVTTGDWEKTVADLVDKLKIKVLLDALGGGQVQAAVIRLIKNGGTVIIYGILEANEEMHFWGRQIVFGLTILGFFLYAWLPTISKQERDQIAKDYSNYLKNQLVSTTSRQFKFSEIAEALAYYKENPSEGKVLLRP